MRKSMVFFIALAMLAAGGAAWADTNTLSVQASVLATCKFSNPDSTLSFGVLDPSVGGNVTVSTPASYSCTKGVTPIFVANMGVNAGGGTTRKMIDIASGDLIPYTLTLTSGTPGTLTIRGDVLGTDYTTKSAGGYSDTVTITLTP